MVGAVNDRIIVVREYTRVSHVFCIGEVMVQGQSPARVHQEGSPLFVAKGKQWVFVILLPYPHPNPTHTFAIGWAV